ncbi:MAG: DegT/DnrJ/EryC1/StrS family aminotransferase [Bacteroidales bacterium]|nr:DegT/DnrJ/EryC1/StrS family aminotransferase [Bacteroidales bacterium]
MRQMQMVDLVGQYNLIREEIDNAITNVVRSAAYINGAPVKQFATNLAQYLGVKHVIPCGNGTDALQIALMVLDLQPGDEVIVPAFTYIAPAEAALLLGLKPVFVDVDAHTFNIDVSKIESAISPKTKAIIAVHLFGQSCDMEAILAVANQHNLYVIEDNAQSIGCEYCSSDGRKAKTGTMGHIGCLSFFPSKNLGCFGDGGAMLTNDDELANRLKMIANHGQEKKYYHEVVGVNSRLDTIQAAVLDVKLKHLDHYVESRRKAAQRYNELLQDCESVVCPKVSDGQQHVFHQYTLQVPAESRDALVKHLSEVGVPTMIYYPLPLHYQNAFRGKCRLSSSLAVSEHLSKTVLSLPMHTELTLEEQIFVCDEIKRFFII